MIVLQAVKFMLTCVTLCCGYICFIPLCKSLYLISVCYLSYAAHCAFKKLPYSLLYVMDGHVDLICPVIWRFSENAVFHMILALSFSINAVVVRTMVWSDRSQIHTDRVDNGRMVLASFYAVMCINSAQ